MSRFAGVEQFQEGGSPKLIVPHDVLDKYGAPDIDFDQLERLFTDDIDLKVAPADLTIKAYDGSGLGMINPPFDVWRKGFHTPYTNTLRIPTWTMRTTDHTFMKRVIGVSLNLEKQRQRPRALRPLATEVAIGSGALLVAGITQDIPLAAFAGEAGVLGAAGSKALHSDAADGPHAPKGRIHELRLEHDSDIVFAKQQDLHYLDKN